MISFLYRKSFLQTTRWQSATPESVCNLKLYQPAAYRKALRVCRAAARVGKAGKLFFWFSFCFGFAQKASGQWKNVCSRAFPSPRDETPAKIERSKSFWCETRADNAQLRIMQPPEWNLKSQTERKKDRGAAVRKTNMNCIRQTASITMSALSHTFEGHDDDANACLCNQLAMYGSDGSSKPVVE